MEDNNTLKRKTFIILFAAETLVFIAGALLCGNTDIQYPAFPFVKLGEYLKALSLSGGPGKILSVILYVIFCLAPLLLFIPRLTKKARGCAEKFHAEDILPIITTGYLFLAMLFIINPEGIVTHFASVEIEAIPLILSGFVWLLIIAFITAKLFRLYLTEDTKKLRAHLSAWLAVLGSFILFSLCFANLSDVVTELKESFENNVTFPENNPVLGRISVVLRFFTDALIAVANLIIIIKIAGILEPSDSDKKDVGALAGGLANFCIKAFSVCMVAFLAVYAFVMIFAPYVPDSGFNIGIPVVELIAIIIIMLFSRIISENKRLRDDNDLFI